MDAFELSKRKFSGIWFPKEIWFDSDLTAIEKIILLEIDSLDSDDGCFASNDYLSKFCQCSVSTVTRAISKLTKLGYIETESFDGRSRVIHSNMKVVTRQTSQIDEAASSKRPQRVLIDNTSSKEEVSIYAPSQKKTKRKAKPFVPPTLEEVKAYIKEKDFHFSADNFFNYYSASNWHFSNGKPVRSWKQCCVTWENNNYGKTSNRKELSRDYDEYEF